MSDTQPTEPGKPKPDEKPLQGKYNIHIEHAQGLAIGDNARVERSFYGTEEETASAIPPQIRERMIRLRELLNQRLDLEELRTLGFDLGIEYDSLRGEGKTAKLRELLIYLERRNEIERLEDWLRRHRPDIAQALAEK